MRRIRREINIFNMSALDLFASALGAFIVIAVVLFPYYLKNSDLVQQLHTAKAQQAKAERQLQQTKAQLAQCEQQNQQSQQQLQQANQAKAECLEKLAQTFLAVVMKWPTQKHDVDLHVVDPAGHEFFFSKNNRNRNDYPSSKAELSVDTVKGPGIEIWEQPQAKPGMYQVYYHFYLRHGGVRKTTVSGSLYYRNGMKKLPLKTLTREKQKVLVATVVLDEQGEVHIR